MKWIPFAMVRVAAFLIGGVVLGIYCPSMLLSETSLAWTFVLLCAGYGAAYFMLRERKVISLFSGAMGLLCVFLAGYLNVLHHNQSRKPDHIIKSKGSIEYYLATLNNSPEEKETSWKVDVSVKCIRRERAWHEASGSVLLYISKQSTVPVLHVGEQVLVKGSPAEVSAPGNPYEFDFRRFLSFKNIYHQHFIKGEDVRAVSPGDAKGFLYYSQVARKWSSEKIRSFVNGRQEQAIALALVLGVTDGLDNDLQNAYAASGAMHVLAVSGLHVGIIYWMILMLLKPIRKFSWSEWPIAAMSLVCLWSYAFVTGLSPSVLRAVTMFSFIAVAKPFSRTTNIYNTLAASVFILLMVNPYLIMSVGFQLSYLAVLGIVYLQRPLRNLWEPNNKFLDWCWSITCVSIAAQIATCSLGLLYFHQFPVYFLFSNLFVIPGSFVVLVLGIAVLALSFIPPVAAGLGWLLGWSIKILNAGVFAVEDLPFSLINGVYLTTFQCWLLMGIVIALICLLEFRKFHWFAVASVFAVAFTAMQWHHFNSEVNRAQLVVYRVSGHGAFEWIDHGQSTFYADSLLVHDPERIKFHIQPNRIGKDVDVVRLNSPQHVRQFQGFRYFDFDGTTLAWIEQCNAVLPKQIKADYLLIGNNAVKSLAEVLERVDAKKVILDSSNSFRYEQKLLLEAQEKNIPLYSVQKQGAFSVTL